MPNCIHIALVSRQPMPNLISALKYKPTLVVLLTTEKELSTAENLKKVLTGKGIRTIIGKEFLEPYDLKKNREIVNKFINKYKNEKLVLNITGGTKLMALSAFQCFAEKNLRVIYCDTDHNKIIRIQQDDTKVESMDVKITIRDNLEAHGYLLRKSTSELSLGNNFAELINENVKEFIEFSDGVKKIVSLSNPSSAWQNQNFGFYKNIDKITIKHLKSGQKFSTSLSGFTNGKWLEELSYYKIYKMGETQEFIYDDLAINLKLESKSGIKNEIDIAFTYKSKLHLISCKSKFNEEKSDLYELETLRSVAGGTYGEAFIIVTHEPGHSFKKRAAELNIQIIEIYNLNKYSFV